MLIKGILSFPTLFTPKIARGATEPKYSTTVLLPPNDPQVQQIQAEVDTAKLNGFPSGYTGADECFGPYDVKYAGKDYYDPRFSGWYVFSCTAKADDRPSVVDLNFNDIIDPGAVYSGMVAYVNANISAYTKGKGGIGGWLNGVMITNEEPPMGRLDNKPTTEQMFAAVPGAGNGAPVQQPMAPPAQGVTPPGMPPSAPAMSPPTPPVPPAPTAPAAPVQLQMTAAANGATYDQMIAAGWTDDQLIAQGMAIKPSFA